MNLDELYQDLNNLATELTELDKWLLETSKSIVDQLKSQAPVDSGDLKNSIKAEVINNTLVIKMLNYGVFQNYGVSGTKDNLGKPTEFGISIANEGTIFKFDNRRFGIKSKNFFNVGDITDEVIEKIIQQLNL